MNSDRENCPDMCCVALQRQQQVLQRATSAMRAILAGAPGARADFPVAAVRAEGGAADPRPVAVVIAAAEPPGNALHRRACSQCQRRGKPCKTKHGEEHGSGQEKLT
eukprot:6200588-Pleurochrysis_carterae.AAC.4